MAAHWHCQMEVALRALAHAGSAKRQSAISTEEAAHLTQLSARGPEERTAEQVCDV